MKVKDKLYYLSKYYDLGWKKREKERERDVYDIRERMFDIHFFYYLIFFL